MPSPVADTKTPVAPLPVIGEISSQWSPDTDRITTHTGASIPTDLAFVGAPPTGEIGEVLSAYSTVRQGKGGNPNYLRRVSWAIMGAWLCVIVIVAFGTTLNLLQPTVPWIVFSSVLGFVLGWIFSAPENSTTYVGEHGAAKFVWKGKNKAVLAPQVIRYEDVTGVNVSQTRHYHNGIYTGTEYAFTFAGQPTGTGKPATLFVVRGRFYRSQGPADNNEEFHFGTAMEAAYSQYRFGQAVQVLAAGGSVAFPVGNQGALAVSEEGLKIMLNGKSEFVPKENIAGLGIDQGMVTITRKGFKKGVLGIGSQGVYSFPYSGLANARLFLALLGYTLRDNEPEDEAKPPQPMAAA